MLANSELGACKIWNRRKVNGMKIPAGLWLRLHDI